MRLAAIICWLAMTAPAFVHGAPAPSRPAPAQGSGARTLVVYSQTHAAYSLLNSLELLKLQLGRFDSRFETLPLFQVTPEKLRLCDYLVVLALDAHESMPTNLIAAIASAEVPVLWVGLGIDPLAQIVAFREQFQIGAASQLHSARLIRYHGKQWDVGAFNFREVHLPKKSAAQSLISAPAQDQSDKEPLRPLCWKMQRFTIFAAEPQNGALGFVFEDLLFDFFGVKETRANSVLIRISGYHPESNHRDFKRTADYLHARSIPFAVSFRGLTEKTSSTDDGAEFISALRYGQQRGGRMILLGTEPPSGRPEFWDDRGDRPRMQITGGGLRHRITSAAEAAINVGLLPIAWETPQYAASSYTYQEIATVFGTAVERVQLSDATSRETYAPAGLARDQYGRLLLPDNLGFIGNTSNGLAGVQINADLLAALRGSILGASFDSYLPFPRLVQLVDLLESYHFSFLDMAELGNRVELPDQILLTGDATASVSLQNATIRWKTFNRAGQLLAEDEQRTKASGRRDFKRIGIGTFELVQFSNQ